MQPTLILKHRNTNNGIVVIDVINHHVMATDDDAQNEYQLFLSYAHNLPTRKIYGQYKKQINTIASDDGAITMRIPFRVPLLPYSYRFEYHLQITTKSFKQNTETQQLEVDCEQIYESEYNVVSVPPISIHPRELSHVRDTNGETNTNLLQTVFVLDCIVGATSILLEHNCAKCGSMHFMIIPRPNATLYPIKRSDLINLCTNTDPIGMFIETVLGFTEHTHRAQYHSCYELASVLSVLGHSVSGLISLHICEFLYPLESKMQIRCPLGHHNLKCDQVWKLVLQSQMFIHFNRLFNSGFVHSFSMVCDMCNVRLSLHDFAFLCPRSHCFCVRCVHSLYTTYHDMKPVVFEALKHALPDDCIQEIVAFCFDICKHNKPRNRDLDRSMKSIYLNE